ncbi:putative permease of the major facilitator superfamily protein [Cellulomonas hominis]|jgi:DHA1 family inner membrane transport protein|uniref:DHA1 family inner membrane transport protein n=1 Tax=Cellulomonas hominis TaxID=156981 RepID=A0A511FL64_9CELL|nr:MFS transporter [Cellulomonas hominis]MBB5471547.1 DHA1 family inner membrane transport protein [Cellulomonas hominis]GEL48608.1 putative permease of the major facilitator superfamily protein [Cellulomonas hominis]
MPTTTTGTPADALDPGLVRRRARLPLLALALGGFSIGTTEFTTMGLLPQIADDLQVSIPTAGHVITAYALGVVVGAPLLTTVAARMDRRTLLLVLMAAFTVGNVLSALAPTAGWLVAARFAAGLPHGAFFGVGAAMGAHVAGPGRRGQAVATMMAGLTIANVVGVPLSTVLGQAFGWRAAFVAVGALGLATLAALWRFVPGLAVADGVSVRTEVRALRNARLWVVCAAGAIGFGGMFAVYSYVAPLLTDVTGVAEATVPLVLALFGVGMTVGTLLGGRLADRSVPRTVLLGFATTIVALVLIAVVAQWVVPGVLAVVALGVTSQVLGIALQSWLMDLSPQAPSLGAALCHSALNVGNAAGAWAGGVVIAAGLGYLAPAWVGAGLTAAGLVIAVFVLPRRRAV